jgi:hypothetical protein
MERLDSVIGIECVDNPPLVEHSIIDREMEVETALMNGILQSHLPNMSRRFRFSARADLITWKTLWELKCTNTITIEHKLQTVLYAWLWHVVNTPDICTKKRNAQCVNSREVRVFNIKTGEILRLNATFDELTIIVVELLRGKYERTNPKSNEELWIFTLKNTNCYPLHQIYFDSNTAIRSTSFLFSVSNLSSFCIISFIPCHKNGVMRP